LVDDFILLAEEDMYAPPDGSRPLKLRSMEDQVTTTVSSGRTLSLPSDYQEIRRVRINDSLSGDLIFRAPNQIKIHPASGRPVEYTITNQIELDREVNAEYDIEIQYIKKLDALSNSNQTNDILTEYPKIYLYGALYHAMVWAEEDSRTSSYLSQFVSAINAANRINKKGRFGMSGNTVSGPTP
jgi:hypothetical protein